MSADLFAEFNDLSSAPPPPPPPQQQQQQQQRRPGVSPQDYFGFSQSGQVPIQSPKQPQDPWGTPQGQPGAQGGWGSGTTPATTAGPPGNPPTSAADDDDGWGDFEVAQPGADSQPTQSQPDPWEALSKAGSKPDSQPPPQTRLMRAPTLDIMSNSLVDTSGFTSPVPNTVSEEPRSPPPEVRSHPRLKEPANPNIMFDAAEFELEGGEGEDDEDDDNDFGAFETAAPEQAAPVPKAWSPPRRAKPEPPPSMDLLSLDEPSASEVWGEPKVEPAPVPPTGLGFGATTTAQHRPSPKTSREEARPAKPSNQARSPAVDADEWSAWDDFEKPTSKPRETTVKTTAKTTIKKGPKPRPKPEPEPTDNWDWNAVDAAQSAGPTQAPKQEPRDDEPPPTNVPPPSVLLSAFPGLFSSGSDLLKPMAGKNTSIKQRILSDPKAVDFLQGYILIATTAARVIAGRKHRWHRDKLLAKSMSISAAGSKGMKLAGVDKTQSAREDREAADVAAAWREHVGPLRSAAAAAKSLGKASLRVPEVGVDMQVTTAKFVPTAPKPCVICGLKREERVAKVDFEVEDSFGEWWVDHWGHRACRNFWRQHEQALRQR